MACVLRYAAAPDQQLDDEVEGAEDLGPGSAFRGGAATLSPQSSLPRHRRKRRNSLVVVTKHLNTSIKKLMCVLRVPVTTPTKATMMQTKSSSAASSFNNLMVSSMKSQCGGPAPAEPRRPAVSRHRQWPSSAPLSRLVWIAAKRRIPCDCGSASLTRCRVT